MSETPVDTRSALLYINPWHPQIVIRLTSVGRVLTLGWRGSAARLMSIYGSAALLILSPYMERARGHVTAARSRDLASPIYGHVGALIGCIWPRDLSHDLTSRRPVNCVCICNGCNVHRITHVQLCEPSHWVQWDLSWLKLIMKGQIKPWNVAWTSLKGSP